AFAPPPCTSISNSGSGFGSGQHQSRTTCRLLPAVTSHWPSGEKAKGGEVPANGCGSRELSEFESSHRRMGFSIHPTRRVFSSGENARFEGTMAALPNLSSTSRLGEPLVNLQT